MNRDQLIEALLSGSVSREQFKAGLDAAAVADLGHARLDLERPGRTGQAEAVYCERKTPEQVADIFQALLVRHGRVLGTRAGEEHRQAVEERLESAGELRWDACSRLLTCEASEAGSGVRRELRGKVLVVTAGTSDIPVAEEAAGTSEYLGSRVERCFDCGVAGVHRLGQVLKAASDARVVVVAAGMDGALPGVVAGLVRVPVVALPTSVGYGASFQGLAALLTMLNACAPGVLVVNIDNGFGAGYAAHLINAGVSD
ncbi:MAG: nickel pincer cofactor biosynthesis protein LarB [Desulfovibrio sp.]